MVLAIFLRWCRLKRTHIFFVRLRLFAVKRRNDGSCVSVISFNPSSSFPSFPFAWKGTIEKRERLAWCIVLHLEGSSSLRWTIRSPLQRYCAFLPRMWKGGDMYLRLRGNDRQSCTVVPKMYLITSLYLSIFTEISSKSRIFTLFN